jgi:hypothetical protein
VEVGPYAYDEYFEKFDIKWSDDGDTVTYYTYRYYIFNKERSGPGLTEDDDIRMPYPTVAGFQYIISSVPVPLEMFVDLAINVRPLLIVTPSSSHYPSDHWHFLPLIDCLAQGSG